MTKNRLREPPVPYYDFEDIDPRVSPCLIGHFMDILELYRKTNDRKEALQLFYAKVSVDNEFDLVRLK